MLDCLLNGSAFLFLQNFNIKISFVISLNVFNICLYLGCSFLSIFPSAPISIKSSIHLLDFFILAIKLKTVSEKLLFSIGESNFCH